jgi:hypothetical protein
VELTELIKDSLAKELLSSIELDSSRTLKTRIICSLYLFNMKLESISVAGKDANQSGVGKKFLIISISITVLLNLSIAIWFFMNDMGRFLIK